MLFYVLEVIVFGIWYYYVCMSADIKKANTNEVFQPVNVLAITLIATGMCFFVNFQLTLVNNVLPESLVTEYTNMMEEAGYGIKLIPTIICLVLAPFGEEFLFRGVLFYYLLKVMGDSPRKRLVFWIANITQALLFGLFHMNLIQGGYAFLIGLVLGYLVYQYDSILPAIMVHILHNLLSAFVWKILVEALPEGYGAYTIGACLSLCVIVLGMMLSVVNNEKIYKE